MPNFKLAHFREHGVDLIVVPLDGSFGRKSKRDQEEAIAGLQARSNAAGLRGTVVPVWDSGNGQMAFIAPPNWHPFFSGLDLQMVWANVNRELSW